MKLISKKGQEIWGNRFAAAPLRHMLKNMSEKIFPNGSESSKSALLDDASLSGKSARAARRHGKTNSSSMAQQCEAESTDNAGIEQLKDALAEADAEGLVNFPPLDHPLTIAYTASLQQGNRMIYVSRQIANLGFAHEAWLDDTNFRLQQVHEDDRELFADALQRCGSSGERFSCHYRLYDSSGKVRWFHDEANVLPDESGMPLFLRGVMLDITDKKEMEAELHGHRYNLERNVEQRSSQLMRRLSLLESCNASLCDKLALAQSELTALRRQSAALVRAADPAMEAFQPVQAAPLATINVHDEQLSGISEWARNMIEWRVSATGSIS